MYAALPALLKPSTIAHALRANLSTEPKVLFVYALLLVVPWVVWQGHRTQGPEEPRSEGSSDPGTGSPDAPGA